MYSSATGLSLPQFAASLRLVAAAQHGLDLWSPALVSSVLYPPTCQQRFGTLPAPRLGVEELIAAPISSPKPPRYASCQWRCRTALGAARWSTVPRQQPHPWSQSGACSLPQLHLAVQSQHAAQ